MDRSIGSALISVFNKTGLEPIVKKLSQLNVRLYSTGGTQKFIEDLGIPVTAVESLTSYPSILGGRVKTLHPKVFGGILARRNLPQDLEQLATYEIPQLDLVIVDLYPFEDTLKETDDEQKIIEKIDIGGVSLIRAAAKNFSDVCVVAARSQYEYLEQLLSEKNGVTSRDDRKKMAKMAFAECAHYDVAIANYFAREEKNDFFQLSVPHLQTLRYGENPHQSAAFYGDINEVFTMLNGKELSFNNLVDIDAACKLIAEFSDPAFAVIKHTNVCGLAVRENLLKAWEDALAGDPESAFGGILVTNSHVTTEVATKINELFFEILVAPGFEDAALDILKSKKNRILLQQKKAIENHGDYKNILNGTLVQGPDKSNFLEWNECGARSSDDREREDLLFANIVCKHLKSNAIAIVKNKQLIGKGCGQTSRIDALRNAIEKGKQFGFELEGSVFASDAFFPFDDCVRIAFEAGIRSVIHPGGSVRDADSIKFCREHNMVMVITGSRHFRH